MKAPSHPTRIPLSLAASVAIFAATGVLSAQVTLTEKKAETRTSPGGSVQTSETRTTESVLPRPGFTLIEGTVTRMDGATNKLMVRTKKSQEPIGFVVNSATKLTDLDGKPVAAPLLVSGVPVRLYYAEDHNTLVAADLQVQRIQVPLPDGTTTFTTRETLKPGGKTVAETSTLRTTTVNGTLTTLDSGRISVTVPGAPSPVVYLSDPSTVVLDAAGQPVAVSTLAPGTPLSVAYVKDGDRLLAREVSVVKTTSTAVPAVPVKP